MDDACNFLRLDGRTGNHVSMEHPPDADTLESAPCVARVSPLWPGRPSSEGPLSSSPKLLVWSAADEDGLSRLAKIYSDHLSQAASSLSPEEAVCYLENLAYTLAKRRTSFDWKGFVISQSIATLGEHGVMMSKAVRSGPHPTLGFVFTGQGAQYAGMAKDLLRYPVFQMSLRRSEICYRDLGCPWSLLGTFYSSTTENLGNFCCLSRKFRQ